MLFPRKESSSFPSLLHEQIDRDENNNIINNSINQPVIRLERERSEEDFSSSFLNEKNHAKERKKLEEKSEIFEEKENWGSSRIDSVGKSDLKVSRDDMNHVQEKSDYGQSEDEDGRRFKFLNQRIEIGFKRRRINKDEIKPISNESRIIKNAISNQSDNEGFYTWNNYYFIRDGDFSIVKFNVFVFIIGHICYLYSLYLLLSRQVMWLTYGWTFWMVNWAGVGIGSGAHRLWAHKSYEARFFFKSFLMIGSSLSSNYSN